MIVLEVEYMSSKFDCIIYKLYIFIHVFLDFSLCLATCSCIPGDKEADQILLIFFKFVCVIYHR